MNEVQNRIIGIVGRKGSGKSSRLRELLRYCPCWIAFDPMGEHAPEKVNRFDSPAELAQFLKWSREERAFASAYVPGADLAEEIEEVARLVYARGHLCFACEEVPLYTQAGYMPPLLGKLIRTGARAFRHRRCPSSGQTDWPPPTAGRRQPCSRATRTGVVVVEQDCFGARGRPWHGASGRSVRSR